MSDRPGLRIDWRLIAAVLLLAPAVAGTWWTIEGLAARRTLRTELAEISHARYDLLNADRWVARIVPILDARIDALDFTKADRAGLKPTVIKALNRLLEQVKNKMTAPPANGSGGGLMGAGNAMMANLMMNALKPHVAEYADIVLAEIGRPDTKAALKRYVRGALTDAARTTFGHVDMRWSDYVFKKHNCTELAACQQEIGRKIAQADAEIKNAYLAALATGALAFAVLMLGVPALARPATVVLMVYCAVLLAGGILTPMIEVEAKITSVKMTFAGTPIVFQEQSLYYQSKSVLEVFRTLIHMGQPEMWAVGVLVLLFSVVFPALKILTLSVVLFRPGLLGSRVVRFLALESSKWSMADVMVLAIFMSFVAFNGLIFNTMGGLREIGAQIAIPTESSKILPGYYLFIGFCLASLFLSKKLERGLRTPA
ncbi:MAG: paraquat-inducible protein A [Candidatus Solibacter sp.]